MIIDAHVHIENALTGTTALHNSQRGFGYSMTNVLSCPTYFGITQNIDCIFFKAYNQEITYAFGGLEYETKRTFLDQAKSMKAMGFDGFKMLEGKPTERQKIKIALDDNLYDDFYSFAEDNNMPILFHIADPREFWDKDLIPDWAVEAGYFYNEAFVPYKQYYIEIEHVLNKHPNLKAIFAHFYFLSDNFEYAQQFLDKFPNAYLDVTSGTEMYFNFTNNIEVAKTFFEKYSSRIIFGTDSEDNSAPEEVERMNTINNMQMDFLTKNETIDVWDKKVKCINLDKEKLENILCNNFLKLVGQPKKLDNAAVLEEIAALKAVCSSAQLEKLDTFENSFK